jgi:EmrB/QacA subfamily drug resistance transporter
MIDGRRYFPGRSASRGRVTPGGLGSTFVITTAAVFMVQLDNLVVATALPSIRKSLGVGLAGLQSTVLAYTLLYASFLLTAAALGDRFGRRRIFAAGLTLFTMSSAVAATAPDIGVLVAARAGQGLGAAVVAPLSLTLLSAVVPREKRGLILGAWSGLSGIAIALGPLVGGFITQHASWQWIFWINVPIGVILVPLVIVRIRESRGPHSRLDVPGTLLATAGLSILVFGIIAGAGDGWFTARVIGAFATAAILLCFFVAREKRVEAPVLPLRLFRNRGFTVAGVAWMLMAFSMFGAIFLMTQFLQTAQGYAPFTAGVLILPWSLMPAVSAPLSGLGVKHIGARGVVTSGLVLQAWAYAWIAGVASPRVGYGWLIPALLAAGVGTGLLAGQVPRVILHFAPPEHEGMASGISSTFRQVGSVLGVAVMGSVFGATGGYASSERFVAGLRPALALGAAVVAVAAALALYLPALAGTSSPERTSVAEAAK